jgi:hypothetical protein
VGLPRGLYGLYRNYLDRLVPEMLQVGTSQRWIEEYQPLLGCLGVATPAAPMAMLPEWLQRPEGEVVLLLNDVVQISEYDPRYGGGYRLYHRSMAEFLNTSTYNENGTPTLNRYFSPLQTQHARIIQYYLTNFGTNWEECDSYGLRQLVSHMQMRLYLTQKIGERRGRAAELYAVVLDQAFQTAQRQQFGDIQATLADLRTALTIALDRDDLVPALRCVAAYRDAIYGGSIADAIFEAVGDGDFEQALQQAAHYGEAPKPRGRWARVLRFYLAWEATEAGRAETALRILTETEPLYWTWAERLCDALLVGSAHALARRSGEWREARAWLAELAPDSDGDRLLREYTSAPPMDDAEQQTLLQDVELQLEFLERVGRNEPGDEETIAALFVGEERMGEYAANMGRSLARLADQSGGRRAIDRALAAALPVPYPEYRDAALVTLGAAALASSDASWVRSRLQRILRTTLDEEGITFTFELPSILLAEANRRHLPARDLADYLDRALSTDDRWGTVTHARSGRAAALHWQNRKVEALHELLEAARQPPGFSGYASLAWLSLANRCSELGQQAQALQPLWGPHDDKTLLDGAMWFAGSVRNPSFRERRIALVETYATIWWNEDIPDIEQVRETLAATPDPDARRVYKELVSARWVSPQAQPYWEGLKALVPIGLTDATTLDFILGRLIGPRLRQFSDDELQAAVDVCAVSLMTGRPWELVR